MIKLTQHLQSIENTNKTVYSGFQLTFSNGNTISVQFGFGNYCNNSRESKDNSLNAEIAIWSAAGKWYNFDFDTVKGYCEADEVAKWVNFAANNEIK